MDLLPELRISSTESSVKSFEANAAPLIPSFPVEEPTIKTGFPGPFAIADIMSPFFMMPAENALTKGFVL